MSRVDFASLRAFPLKLFFDETYLAHATGFLWNVDGRCNLVTNWHVVSGKNPNTLKHVDPKTCAEPSRIELDFWHDDGHCERIDLALRSPDGVPRWLVHPENSYLYDVVSLPIDAPAALMALAINELPQSPVSSAIGTPLFILGYPFEPERYPIWKQATIASEPALTPAVRPYFLVDTASRPGMSGSPVICRPSLHSDEAKSTSTTFVGIYSGRLHTNSPMDAQLGMVWPASVVEEVARDGITDI